MSQTVQPGSDNFMHCTPQSKATQNMLVDPVSPSSASSDCSSPSSSSAIVTKNSIIMRPFVNYSYPNTNGSTTPVSTRSSVSCESNTSSSSSSVSMPKRSSMKSSLGTSQPVGTSFGRRLSPPTVRFADPEPLPKSYTWPASIPKTTQQTELWSNSVPNPLLQFQHHRTPSLASPVSSSGTRYTVSRQPYVAPLQPQLSRLPEGLNKPSPNWSSDSDSAPVLPDAEDPIWFPFPLPSHSTTANIAPGSRLPSHQSTISNLSTQSAPAVLSTPASIKSATPSQFNPLEHYQPCLYSSCTFHYTPAYASPIYYLPHGPYSLATLHGYCPHHATQEMKETNAICKKQWESLRQNAGRKTLGQIAADFEVFLERFRQERNIEDARLIKQQKTRMLGAAQPAAPLQSDGGKGKAKQIGDADWDWRYTPRWCTNSSCSSAPYSPYANHLYAFYHTRRPSKFFPLQNLCPSCSRPELEVCEDRVTRKWSSRCGWNEAEWNEWLNNVVRDRETESEFWTMAQERVVRERGAVQRVDRVEEGKFNEGAVFKKKGRRSVLSRLFGSMTTLKGQ